MMIKSTEPKAVTKNDWDELEILGRIESTRRDRLMWQSTNETDSLRRSVGSRESEQNE